MKTALKSLALLLTLIGTLWALQGVGLVGGSFMTGRSEWLYIGVCTLAVGLALFLAAFRR